MTRCRGNLIAINKSNPKSFKLPSRFPASFKMAGNQDEEQIGNLGSQSEKQPTQQGLFPCMSATSQQHSSFSRYRQLAQHSRNIKHSAFVQFGGVKFHAADHPNCFWPA